MTQSLLFALGGLALFLLALHAFLTRRHLVRRVIALNVMAGGIFLFFGAMAARGEATDPVPQALVITGIVVSLATTALALALTLRLYRATGCIELEAAAAAAEREQKQG
ncbi:NADH-quinone oxidoreductase subunit K [Aquibaculum arenosum]|uniref:NADH-quinone oxidoreductase subunit K n=1 Tax=Aquibaculum arenosum TaxID=3032591 RepID=A0ABT5YIA7_9PROT|nr:NADH-quinone oxidoreductase subunit K [Fodinicurvata sp. CAU 1616]MDF2094540.1 NADH-quinone oxidoreductase subunit K [Fodinicurvata sp. CAU 1616]